MKNPASEKKNTDPALTVTIDDRLLTQFAAELLEAAGFTEEESCLTAQSLVLSNLLGHDSHGVIRVHEYIHFFNHKEVFSGAQLTIKAEGPGFLKAEAGYGLGQVQMPRLLEKLVPKASQCGVATGTIRQCGHTGRIGEWVEKLAAQGLAAMIAVNDNGGFECVAPPGGKQARTSTNPIAFAIPLPDGNYFSFDMSTSAVAIGKMRLAHIAGEECAAGLLQDADGRPTNDPSVLFSEPKGCLLPFGGAQAYKGFGLSMMVDCLVAGMSGGFTPPAPQGEDLANNVMITAWSAEAFDNLEHMQRETQKYIDYVRQTEPVDPAYPVRVPGDRSRHTYKARLEHGIPISLGTVQKLSYRAETYGIQMPDVFSTALKS